MQENAKFISLEQVLEIIPVSRSTWLRGVSAGEYPEPIKVSKRLKFWNMADIQDLVDKLINHEARRGQK